MDKKHLRTYYKKLRNILSEQEKAQKSLAIANQILKLDIWQKSYYHLFLTIEELNEVDTEPILQILMGKDKEIVISKSDFETRVMTNYLLTENTRIKKNGFNIPEPINGLEVPEKIIDVVFVPLLAYDKLGNRVGYGKGFYDLFLSKCNKNVIKIGISFFDAEQEIDDVNFNDIKLDCCVHPSGVYYFNS